jgi:hypothetical protein
MRTLALSGRSQHRYQLSYCGVCSHGMSSTETERTRQIVIISKVSTLEFANIRRPLRAVVLVAGVALLLFGVAPAAFAASFYWYGENDSTCWQVGQLGAPSNACDGVGVGFLTSGHMIEGGIGPQAQVSTSGDYCGYYRLGDALTYQDSVNEGPATGFTTPTPYYDYQEDDPYENACQASGANWGQEVRKSAPGNGCSTTCGMNHYVSFGSQGLADRPWSSSFGGPELVLSASTDPQTFSHSGTNLGAWGYLCPVLEDATTGGILEYCLEEWRSKYNSAEWSIPDRVATCASYGGKSIDTIITTFNLGTRFASEIAGSSNTFVLESVGSRYFTAAITPGDLQNAIKEDLTVCGRTLSTDPTQYALLGVEQGLEGWRELSELAGSTANLQLRTEYTPRPPEATTSTATEVSQTQATLNGAVNPEGTDTHYYFQYGTTADYGSSTGSIDSGSGVSTLSESAIVSGLQPGATYHYRLVASNSSGTSYGSDETFTLPAGVRVYFVGSSDSEIHELSYNSGIGWAQSAALTSPVAQGTSPSAFLW